MRKLTLLFSVISLLALFSFGFFLIKKEDSVQAQATGSQNAFEMLNQKARIARTGEANAVQEYVESIVQVTGFQEYLTGQMGSQLKDRVKRAEISYRQGQHPGINEEKVVLAVNGLVEKLQTPAYSLTSLYEVRRLRVSVLPIFPEVIGKNRNSNNVQNTGDNLPSEMSPAEAVFVFASLLYQKMYNPDYQLTPAERANLWATEHDYKQNYEASLPERAVNNNRDDEMEEAVTSGFLRLSANEAQNLPFRALTILGLQP